MSVRFNCLLLLALAGGCAAPPAPHIATDTSLPLSGYEELLPMLDASLDSAMGNVDDYADRHSFPAAARLWSADSRLGPWLLSSGFIEARTNMAALRERGVEQIDIAIAHPVLTGEEDRAEEYRNVYGRIAGEARSQGLALRVISGPQYRDAYKLRGYPVSAQCGEDPIAVFAKHATEILELMNPDYLTLDISPATLALADDCVEFAAPADAAKLALGIIRQLGPLHVTRVGIAARATEDPAFFAVLLESEQDFYLDVGVFRLTGESGHHIDALESLLAAAQGRGRDAAIGSYWLQKTGADTDSDYLGIAYSSRDAATDTLDLWAPLDRRMHRFMRMLTDRHGLLYASAYRSDLLFAYLPARVVRENEHRPVSLLRIERGRARKARIAYLKQLATERRGST